MFVETKREGEAPIKQGPSLRGLIAWLETKDPQKEYDYYDCGGACLIGQYVNAIGLRWGVFRNADLYGAGWDWWLNNPKSAPLREISVDYPRTFGGALKRAQERLVSGEI